MMLAKARFSIEHFIANKRFVADKRIGGIRWDAKTLALPDECGHVIGTAIADGDRSLLVGKLGSNELKLIQWACNIGVRYGGFNWPTLWFETKGCETNAGAKPRTKKSYRELGQLFVDTLRDADIVGVFKLASEIAVVERLCNESLITQHLGFTPFFQNDPWSQELEGKRVFVVSPFIESFRKQKARSSKIWPEHPGMLPEFEMIPYRFPYLIDPDSNLTWKQVYEDVSNLMEATNFDVALFGCGALGFPLAQKAKSLGKVGIHLGGTLQVLFGVKGQRYESQSHFAKFINDDWIYPSAGETAKAAGTIEGGCYWGPK